MFDELEEEPRVDLTPLIDVIFMLVIFFVMTMTFSKPVLDVVLPAAQNSEVKKKTTELVISVKSDGKYFFNDQEIPKEEVSRFLSEHPDGTLNLMVDEKARLRAYWCFLSLSLVSLRFSTQPLRRSSLSQCLLTHSLRSTLHRHTRCRCPT